MFLSWLGLSGTNVTADESEVGDFVPENIIHPDMDLKAKFAANSVTLTVTPPAARLYSSAGVFGHNLSAQGEIQFEYFFDSVSVGTEELDAQKPIASPFDFPPFYTASIGMPTGDEDQPYRANSTKFFDADYYADEIRITLTDTTLTEIKVAYAISGLTFDSGVNTNYGTSKIPQVTGTFLSGPTGQEFNYYDPLKGVFTLVYDNLTNAEAVRIEDALDFSITKKLPVFVSLFSGVGYPRESKTQGLAWVRRIDGPTPIPSNDKYQRLVITLNEAIRNEQL